MELLLFEVPGCPYCRQAHELLDELYAEHPEYGKITYRTVYETKEPDLADQYDYYYTPSFFHGDEKLYEADPARSRKDAKRMLNDMLERLV